MRFAFRRFFASHVLRFLARTPRRPAGHRARPRLMLLEDRTLPSILVTTNHDQVDPYDGQTSLREALAYAGTLGGSPVITFAPDVRGQIAVSSTLVIPAGNVTIQGPGADVLSIVGGGPTSDFSVFHNAVGSSGTIDGLTIAQGSVVGNGGAIWVWPTSSLTVTHCVLRDNYARWFGGAIGAGYGATLTLDSDSFINNSSPYAGGAVYSDGRSVLLHSVSFTGNHGLYGGGLNNGWNSSATVTGCLFQDNTSDGLGGAINNNGAMTIDSTAFTGNQAGYGGGFFNDTHGTANLVGVTVTDNRAGASGGGIYNNGQVSLRSSLVSGNRASWGGGLYSYGGFTSIAQAGLTDVTFSENTADMSGGGILLDSPATLQSVNILRNTAQYSGGLGMNSWVVNGVDVLIEDNTASILGGGLFNNGGQLQLQSATIDGNTSFGDGGGVFNSGWIVFNGGTISNNSAVNGGGIDSSGTLDLGSVDFTGNTASNAGGGLRTSGSATVQGGTFSENTAQTGGAIFAASGGNIHLKAATLSENHAGLGGGGLWNEGRAHLKDDVFDGNTARNGGGVYNRGINWGYFDMEGGRLSNNASDYAGGGLFNDGAAALYLVLVNANVSHRDVGLGPDDNTPGGGGGIYNNAILNLTSSWVLDNRSEHDPQLAHFLGGGGGGLYNGGTAYLDYADFENNTAADSGGGINSRNAYLTLRSGWIYTNQAGLHGGGIASHGGYVGLTDAFIRQNSATWGGGLDLGSDAEIYRGEITSNRALSTGGGVRFEGYVDDAVKTLSLGPVLIQDNIAGYGGGGLEIVEGRTLIEATTISGNSVTQGDGGGIQFTAGTEHDAELFVASSWITGNTASQGNGGGLHLEALLATIPVTLSEVTVSGNHADLGGGGLYNSGACWLAVGDFENNTAGATGGAIDNAAGGVLTSLVADSALSATVMRGNSAPRGGAVFNEAGASANLQDVELSGNVASEAGGGLYNSGDLFARASVFAFNTTGGSGGGVFNDGQLLLRSGTIDDNTAVTAGGGIANLGALTLENMTIGGNSVTSGNGGGIYSNSPTAARLANVTIANNTAASGGGFYEADRSALLFNTIVAVNHSSLPTGAPDDVAGSIDPSGAHNLFGLGGSGGLTWANGNLINVADPGLSFLGAFYAPGDRIDACYGLLPGSPAIDAGGSAVSWWTASATDQRGQARVGRVDIGAYESQGYTITFHPVAPQYATVNMAFGLPLVVSVVPKYAYDPVAGATVTYETPEIGASAALSQAQVTLDPTGVASVTAVANEEMGHYVVTAWVGGIFAAQFDMTNTEPLSLVVTTLDDVASLFDNQTSLRDALFYNTLLGGGQTVTFDPGLTGPIYLGSSLVLDTPVTIDGGSPGTITLYGGSPSETFSVVQVAGTGVILSNLTIANGSASDGGGVNVGTGADLQLVTVTIAGNQAGRGGGVYNQGRVVFSGSSVVRDNAAGSGGGIHNDGLLELYDTTVAGNTADFGGGIYTTFDAMLAGGLLVSNTATTSGGGVFVAGGSTAALTNVTLAANTAAYGGGLYDQQGVTTTLTNVTISENRSLDDAGGGISSEPGSVVRLANTIVAGNVTGPDGNAPGDVLGDLDPTSLNNLLGLGGDGGLTAANGNLLGVPDPLLAPLGDYGGNTRTYALLPGSVAIDAGAANMPWGGNAPGTDQRSHARIGSIDIGAFESAGFTLTPDPAATPQSAISGAAFANPLTLIVVPNDPAEPVDGGRVRYVANPSATGAGAALSANSAAISGGQAGVTAQAGAFLGSYTVTASAAGAADATFDLTNLEAPSLVVTTNRDVVNPIDGLTSLREALAYAAILGGNPVVTFAANVTGQIALTSGLEVSGNVTINGPGSLVLSVVGGGPNSNFSVFSIDAGPSAAIKGLTIAQGHHDYGSGIHVAPGASLRVEHCVLSDNAATISGGGIHNRGTLTLDSVAFASNSAISGGGVTNDGSLTTVAAVTFTGNRAVYGGGLFNQTNRFADLVDVTMTDNNRASASGGGIYDNGILKLRSSRISGNTARWGGGIYVWLTGSAELSDSTFEDNAADTLGGGIDANGYVSLRSVSVLRNRAQSGAGLWIDAERTVTAYNVTISGNEASIDGGGIANGGTLYLGSATLDGNSAQGNGGGALNTGSITFTGGTVSSNTAAYGGGVHNSGDFNDVVDVVFTHNTARVAGGGLFTSHSAALWGGTFSGNTAHHGGGILVGGGDFHSHWTTVSQNQADWGAGVYNDGTATLDFFVLDGNSATRGGGGLFNHGTLTLGGGEISNNQADYAGGGLYNVGPATLRSVWIHDNVSHHDNGLIPGVNAPAGGGGIYNDANLTITDSTFQANRSEHDPNIQFFYGGGGGGLFNVGFATLTNVSFFVNTAGDSGGAINNLGGRVTVEGGIIQRNQAWRYGGGIASSEGYVELTGTDVLWNSALLGGGVALRSDAKIIGGQFLGNTSYDGGGVWFEGYSGSSKTLTISGTLIRLNSAESDGGGIEISGGYVTIDHATISDNTATRGSGGGVDVWYEGPDLSITDSLITRNSAGGHGGGLHLDGFHVGTPPILRRVTISENRAGAYGGGIANRGSASLTLDSVALLANTAQFYGGGLFNSGSTANLANVTIAGNTALDGGGVHNQYQVFLTGVTVSANRATAGTGGGIWTGSIPGQVAELHDTIVAGNFSGSGTTPGDVSGPLASASSYNLIGLGGSGGLSPSNHNLLGVANPGLAPLGDYGGPTQTFALLPGSPAIDSGSWTIPGFTVPTLDQRGLGRVGVVDLGAFESQGFVMTIQSGNGQWANINTAFASPLTVKVTANNPREPVDGGVVTFSAPGSGASAIPSATGAVISGGLASITARANGVTGSYAVTASSSGATTMSFLLTNTTTVTNQLLTTATGLLWNRTSRTWTGSITLRNTGKQTLTSLKMLFRNLPRGVTLANAAGTLSDGTPYLEIGSLAPGQSITLQLVFNAPSPATAVSYIADFSAVPR